jgi:hypothetical protein
MEFFLETENEPIKGVIDTEKKFREQDLALLIKSSAQAKEKIREAFGIPDMPPPEVEAAIAETNKARRKKKSDLEVEVENKTTYDYSAE